MPDLSRWCGLALGTVADALRDDGFWAAKMSKLRARSSPSAVHLAVLVEPYLDYVLDGTKTIESRFSLNRCAPYEKVFADDVVLLKAASGPVVGICLVGRTWHYPLDDRRRTEIRSKFAKPMRAEEPAFWQARRVASYATLLEVHKARSLPTPMRCPKRDRRGWVVLKPRAANLGLQAA